MVQYHNKYGEGDAVTLQETHIVDRIRLHLPSLSDAESTAARWIVGNADQIPSLSMGQVAAACDVSDTTVLRTCRRVGLSGYTDLKFRIIEEGAHRPASDDELTSVNPHAGAQIASDIFEDCIQGLRDTLMMLTDEIDLAVDMIETADQVLVIGVGTSLPVMQAIQHQLFRMGVRCRTQSDSYLQRMEVALLGPTGLVIGVSHSGASVDPIETMRLAREHDVPTIALTGAQGAPITRHADVVLTSIATERRTEPVVSRVVQIAMASALARAYSTRHPVQAGRAEAAAYESVIGKTL